MNKEWLNKLASDVEAKHGAKAREKIFGDIESVPENHEAERDWFHRFTSGMDELGDKEFLTSALARHCPCGHSEFEKILKKVYDESKTLKEFVDRLESGGLIEDLVSLDGNVLTLTKRPFERYGKHEHSGLFANSCHCGLASQTEQPVSDIFCHCCTVGFYGNMFKNALGVDVKVEFMDSVITGGESCKAAVYLPEKSL